MFPTSRRRVLQGLAALGALGLDRRALASVSSSDLKFVFVFNQGGWDPTRVFATEFSNDNVDMEPMAEPMTVQGITFADHPERPEVKSFFQAYGSCSLVMNGVLVRSIAHEICTAIALTGSTSGTKSDWGATIAGASTGYTMPHLVLGGPSYPGDLGTDVARAGSTGQLQGLLSGSILQQSDVVVGVPSSRAQGIIDQYMQSRARAVAATGAPLSADYESAANAAVNLKGYKYVIDFGSGGALSDVAQVAVDSLSEGLCRCVTLGTMGWDSHVQNDQTQSPLWSSLFEGLNALMSALQAAPGRLGGTLADETVVVVMSEMARTPLLNSFGGKDHWPYTSAMLVGPRITGGRVVGGYDDNYYGLGVDAGTGELDETADFLRAESVGATLLQLAGIDPAEHVPDAEPITGVLA